MQMPCGHNFHEACLLQWLRSHNTCPMCRHSIEADERFPLFVQLFTAFRYRHELLDSELTSALVQSALRVTSPRISDFESAAKAVIDSVRAALAWHESARESDPAAVGSWARTAAFAV